MSNGTTECKAIVVSFIHLFLHFFSFVLILLMKISNIQSIDELIQSGKFSLETTQDGNYTLHEFILIINSIIRKCVPVIHSMFEKFVYFLIVQVWIEIKVLESLNHCLVDNK